MDSMLMDDSFNFVLNDSFCSGKTGKRLCFAKKMEPSNSFYGLGDSMLEHLKNFRGINKLYEWQIECLNKAIATEKNFIYTSPTSGGKTLVAEIYMFREIVMKKKNCILVVPYVSIVHEKVASLSPFGIEIGFHIEEYAGSKGSFPPKVRKNRNTVYVATIEKACNLLDHFIDEQKLSSLGCVVVDELHLIGESGSRATRLEIFLLKLLKCHKECKIIGMSATLSNIDQLLLFLQADLYSCNYRPVSLTEYIKIDSNLYSVDRKKTIDKMLNLERKMNNKANKIDTDFNDLLELLIEVIPSNSCLIFCATKKNCENLSKRIVDNIDKNVLIVKSKERSALLRSLERTTGGLCPLLSHIIPYGIAYHHSGLTDDERKLIEDAYSSLTLCCLCCTSTLAAGVNLPARRVILRSPYVGVDFIKSNQYKQMIGRAGRAGIDDKGDSILIVDKKDLEKVENLFLCDTICVSSLCSTSIDDFASVVLTLISLKIGKNLEEIEQFFNGSFFYICCTNKNQLLKIINDSIDFLISKEMIEFKDKNFNILKEGHAIYKGGMDIVSYQFLRSDLEMSVKNLVLNCDYHLLYLITPYDTSQDVTDWMDLYNKYDCLTPNEKSVCDKFGISESFLCLKITGKVDSMKTVKSVTIKKFFNSLILLSIYKHCNYWKTHKEFKVSRGYIQNLVNSASSFAKAIVRYTIEIDDFWAINVLLEKMVNRLSSIINYEIYELMEIPGVKYGRAHQLLNAGFKSISHVANTNANQLINNIDHLTKNQALGIISCAQLLLMEKIESLREQADDLIDEITY